MSTFKGTYKNPKSGEITRMRFANQKHPYWTQSVRGFLQFGVEVRTRLADRDDLQGAEIGAHIGETAMMINCMVPFKGYQVFDLWKNPECQELFRLNTKMLKGIVGNKMSGLDGARVTPDGTLDFVYIDAMHDYASVRADIDAWLPKVKPGGIISGHDYRENSKNNWGVVQAVNETFENVISFDDHSWMVQL